MEVARQGLDDDDVDEDGTEDADPRSADGDQDTRAWRRVADACVLCDVRSGRSNAARTRTGRTVFLATCFRYANATSRPGSPPTPSSLFHAKYTHNAAAPPSVGISTRLPVSVQASCSGEVMRSTDFSSGSTYWLREKLESYTLEDTSKSLSVRRSSSESGVTAERLARSSLSSANTELYRVIGGPTRQPRPL